MSKRKKRVNATRPGVVQLHASVEQMVWEATIAALGGLTTSVDRGIRSECGQRLVHPEDLQGLGSLAHRLGYEAVLAHVAWASDDPELLSAVADDQRESCARNLAINCTQSDAPVIGGDR